MNFFSYKVHSLVVTSKMEINQPLMVPKNVTKSGILKCQFQAVTRHFQAVTRVKKQEKTFHAQ